MSKLLLKSYLEAVFTERQQQVLLQLMTGRSNGHIAQHLGIVEKSVKHHLTSIYKIMKVKSRSEAIVKLHNYKID